MKEIQPWALNFHLKYHWRMVYIPMPFPKPDAPQTDPVNVFQAVESVQ